MTATTLNPAEIGRVSWLDKFFASLARGFNTYAETKSRSGIIQALQAKTDAELAELGIKREGIPMYVFRDVMYM